MEIYQSEDFIEKYVEKVKRSLQIEDRLDEVRTKINRILQKENLYINDEAYLVLLSEAKDNEIKICNFFVLPTHSLYFDDGEKIHEAGIAVELYSQLSDEKYKRILINLSDEAIEKGNWLTNTTFVDRDFFVHKSDSYRYLRIAIKLSTRILKDKAKKVFFDEEWLEDDEALEHIDDYRVIRDTRLIGSLRNDTESNHKESIDATQFLGALRQYVSEIDMLDFPEESVDSANECGWEDIDYYYLTYTKAWSWVRAYFNRNGVKLGTKEKELDHYLVEAGVLESNEVRPKTELKRADRKVSPLNKPVFKINKVRFAEFLSRMEYEK